MHPLSKFQYCPVCASSRFVENNFKSKECESCGFVYYFNASAATAAFITNAEGQLLVARRAKDPAQGTLDLPGGFIDLDETAEQAMIREIQEETGLIVTSPQYLFSLPNVYPYSGMDIHTVDMFFEIKVSGTEPIHPADDVEALFFLHKEEIDPALFGLISIRKAVTVWKKRYLK